MTQNPAPSLDSGDASRSLIALSGAMVLLTLLWSAWFVLRGDYFYSAIPLAGLAAVIIVTHPRLALIQFAFLLFVQMRIVEQPVVYLTDLSALGLVMAGLLDLLLRPGEARVVVLLKFFAVLIGAQVLTSFFGYDPTAAVHPIARVTFIAATFLSVLRLSRRWQTSSLIALYFWATVVHSLLVLSEFVITAGQSRVFGLSPTTFNTLAYLAMPIGAAYFLNSRRGWLWYAIGTVVVFGAIVATQTRFAILVGGGSAAFLILRAMMIKKPGAAEVSASKKRARMATALFAVVGLIAVASAPEYFVAVVDRFASLFSSTPSDTIRLRVALWGYALEAFSTHPLVGVGPGCFREIQAILPHLRLDEINYWVRGLSAHNLTLHYLAETGLVGTVPLLALFTKLALTGRRIMKNEVTGTLTAGTLALTALAWIFLITALLEAGWMWSQPGFAFAFFAALIVARSREQGQSNDAQITS